MRKRVWSLTLLSGLGRCSIVHKCSSDLALMWLWHRLAATALIQPLAWKIPYVMGAAVKKKKKKWEKDLKIKTQTLATSNFLKSRSLIPNLFNIMSYGEHKHLSSKKHGKEATSQTLLLFHTHSQFCSIAISGTTAIHLYCTGVSETPSWYSWKKR